MPTHSREITPIDEELLAEIKDLISKRHSVRSYQHKPLSQETIQKLSSHIATIDDSSIQFRLVTNEPKAFKGIASYGMFRGVENYLIIFKPQNSDCDLEVGYYGERVVLYAQMIGLNTCWVGKTYKKVNEAFTPPSGYEIACLITIGYGTTQGIPHKKKSVEELSNCSPTSPQWFRRAVEAARLAPSAINQQKFHFKFTDRLSPDNLPIVEVRRFFSLIGYTQIDLGIAMLHFDLAAGAEEFQWEIIL